MKNETINDFKHFKVGTVFNRINPDREPRISAKSVQIKYPSRLNAMAIDPSKITENNNMVYTPGEIVFSIGIFITVKVKLLNENIIEVNNEYANKNTVIKHICLIMKDMLKYSGGFQITLIDYHPYRHCGFGSTGCLQAAVASCVNHLFGQPFNNETLIKLLARNYGEEIDSDDEYLNPVQCIGGSASSGLINGGVIVVAGENTVIAKGNISDEYRVLVGIPENIKISDSVSQFNDEKENLHKFFETGLKHKETIAYQVLHKFLPAIYNGDLSTMGDVIFD
jgi:predicted sugar kinase